MEENNMNDWMDQIQGTGSLPEGKGTVTAINPPEEVDTKFGKRKKIQIVLKGTDESVISLGLFLPQNFPQVHPKSNLAKVMKVYGCAKLQDLIGKEVQVQEVSEGIFKIKSE